MLRFKELCSLTEVWQFMVLYSSLFASCLPHLQNKRHLFEPRAAGIQLVVCFRRWREVSVYSAHTEWPHTCARIHTSTRACAQTHLPQYLSASQVDSIRQSFPYRIVRVTMPLYCTGLQKAHLQSKNLPHVVYATFLEQLAWFQKGRHGHIARPAGSPWWVQSGSGIKTSQ